MWPRWSQRYCYYMIGSSKFWGNPPLYKRKRTFFCKMFPTTQKHPNGNHQRPQWFSTFSFTLSLLFYGQCLETHGYHTATVFYFQNHIPASLIFPNTPATQGCISKYDFEMGSSSGTAVRILLKSLRAKSKS